MYSNRQLKVGETIKRMLVEIIRKYNGFGPLDHTSILISKVLMTADLGLADIYVLPMFGSKMSDVDLVALLNQHAPKIRHELACKITLRKLPTLRFRIDDSFGKMSKIDELLKQ